MNYLQTYTEAFAHPQYSNDDHAQYHYVTQVLEQLKLDSFGLIDIGSGRGQLINRVNSQFPNASITSVDLRRFHAEKVAKFIACDLSQATQRDAIAGAYKVLTCTDVLEHLDKSYLAAVLRRFSELADFSILAIANHSDILNGIELHTIQENNIYWEAMLKAHFDILDTQYMYDGRLFLYVVAPRRAALLAVGAGLNLSSFSRSERACSS